MKTRSAVIGTLKDWGYLGELIDAGVVVHFANESVDLQSRGGRLAADIQAVVAADYVRNLREETLKGIRGRLKQGFYPFAAPLGYLDAGGGKVMTVEPRRGPQEREHCSNTYLRFMTAFIEDVLFFEPPIKTPITRSPSQPRMYPPRGSEGGLEKEKAEG